MMIGDEISLLQQFISLRYKRCMRNEHVHKYVQ